MKRLLYILFPCLLLTSCHTAPATDSTSATPSANVADSTIIKCIADYWRQKNNSDEWFEQGIIPAQQPDPSGRLYEAWYDVTGYLVLVNLKDTTVADDLIEKHAIGDFPEYLAITDSITMDHDYNTTYLVAGDTVLFQEYDYYVLQTNRKDDVPLLDTLLIELSETKYLMADKFVFLSHKDTSICHQSWTAKCYFNEREYNEKLYTLYMQIIRGDSISDEQLLDAMPQNKDQYYMYDYHWDYTCDFRSIVIDSIALARSKDNPIFRDAYLKMGQWSDGGPAEILFDGYYRLFFHLDSVYFRDAVRRILPEYIDMFEDDSVYDEEIDAKGWLRCTREHREEILGWYNQ